ncbi:DUF7739 domain-containing protein [Streptomyces sparsogenes]|uniref:DUF7739 domain-containing protein n=1 Tax=Streptomyces sparsogenes TaxID=67365 RepID=UPI0033CF86F9
MPVRISHGSDDRGEECRSANSIALLGQHLAHVLPSSDWRTIAFLFNGNLRDVAVVMPRKAGKIAAVLRRGAQHRLMPPDWAKDAQALADAAGRAAAARELWEWR